LLLLLLLLLLAAIFQVVTATVDLDEVVSFRAAISSLREQASSSSAPAMVSCDFQLCRAQGLTHPPVPPRVRAGEGGLMSTRMS
jgi:NAD+ synthase (glutamine-hydrolysing)